MPRAFFVWRMTSRGPSPCIFHYDPKNMGRDEKEYAPRVLSYHPIPEDLQERVDRQDCPFAELTKRFPPPQDDA